MKKKILFYFSVAISLQCQAQDTEQIHQLIKLYKRPITFLGIMDAHEISPIAKEFPESVFVVIDSAPITQSLPANIIYLLKDCSVNKLKHLSECEHFDIAYVKNHNNLTQEYAEAIARLGEHLFISLKPDERTLSEGLKKLNFNSIDSPLDSLLYKKQQISFLKRTSWYQDSSEQNNVRHIKSTYEEKIQYKNYGPNPTSNTWLPGINLMTFKTLNGQIPSPETCSSEIERLYTIPHSDWMPNNIIVQGQNLELIDFEDPYINGTKDVKAVHTPKMLEFMKQFVTESDTTKIEENYKKLDTYCRIQIHGRSFFRFLRIL